MTDAILELESPGFTCGHCHFYTTLSGHWSVERGQLVFRADKDPQPRRGPDLDGCCESDPVVKFTKIVTDTDQILEGATLTELRDVAHAVFIATHRDVFHRD